MKKLLLKTLPFALALICSCLPAMAATQPYLFTASFPGLSGQAANLNLVIKDAAGTSRITTATFTEETDAAGTANTGIYDAQLAIDPTWAYPLKASVTMTGQAGVVSVGYIRAAETMDAAGYVKTNVQLGTVTTVTGSVNLAGGQAVTLASGQAQNIVNTLYASKPDPAGQAFQYLFLDIFANNVGSYGVTYPSSTSQVNSFLYYNSALTYNAQGKVTGRAFTPGSVPAAITPTNP